MENAIDRSNHFASVVHAFAWVSIIVMQGDACYLAPSNLPTTFLQVGVGFTVYNVLEEDLHWISSGLPERVHAYFHLIQGTCR